MDVESLTVHTAQDASSYWPRLLTGINTDDSDNNVNGYITGCTKCWYHIMENVWMVQIFAYFEHTSCVKVPIYKNFCLRCRDYPILLLRQLFVYYSTPNVPVNMVGANHLLMVTEAYTKSWKLQICLMLVSGGGAWQTWKIRKFELLNFILMEKLKLYENMCQWKFPAILC